MKFYRCFAGELRRGKLESWAGEEEEESCRGEFKDFVSKTTRLSEIVVNLLKTVYSKSKLRKIKLKRFCELQLS